MSGVGGAQDDELNCATSGWGLGTTGGWGSGAQGGRDKKTFITDLVSLPPQARYPSLLHSARGAGTFCAVDCPDAATRDKLIGKLRNKGEGGRGSGWVWPPHVSPVSPTGYSYSPRLPDRWHR